MAETIENLLLAIASPVALATKAFTGISQYAALLHTKLLLPRTVK